MKRFSNEILNIDRNQLLAFHAWHLKVIIVLSNHKDGLTSKELCVYLGESRSVYRALSELKKEGWVIEQDGVCLFHCQKWFDYCQNLEKEKQIKEKLIKEHDRESNKEKEKENVSKEKLIKEKALSVTFSDARDEVGASGVQGRLEGEEPREPLGVRAFRGRPRGQGLQTASCRQGQVKYLFVISSSWSPAFPVNEFYSV